MITILAWVLVLGMWFSPAIVFSIASFQERNLRPEKKDMVNYEF